MTPHTDQLNTSNLAATAANAAANVKTVVAMPTGRRGRPRPRASHLTPHGRHSTGRAPAPTASQDTPNTTRRVTPAENRLVIGYLCAVAVRLAQRGIPVRALRADEPDKLVGSLTLDTPPGREHAWNPTRLRWAPDTGWSATLNQHRADHPDAVVRYLPARQRVPDPVAVAHFLAALRADPDTIWATATPQRHRPIDHRVLIMRLSRFAPPARTHAP